MFGLSMDVSAGDVAVMIVNGRTRTPEEIAGFAVDKIVRIALTAHPEIAAQAHEFKDRVKVIIASHIQDAIREERNACAMMVQQWNGELAEAIRSR